MAREAAFLTTLSGNGLECDSVLVESHLPPSAHPWQVLRQILDMSVITSTPVPQMQLNTIFTELHVQVRPVSLAGHGSLRVEQQEVGCSRWHDPPGQRGDGGGAPVSLVYTCILLSSCDLMPPPQVCTKAPAQQQYSSQNLMEIVHCFIALGEALCAGPAASTPRPGSVGMTKTVLPLQPAPTPRS